MVVSVNFSKIFRVVDTHMGHPMRYVIGGIPRVKGRTMAEKMGNFEKHFDHYRKALTREPRGFGVTQHCVVFTDPVNDGADVGALYMNGGEKYAYENVSGAGSIGAVTVAVEMGIVEKVEPVTKVVLDTPAGLVTGFAKVENGNVMEVTIRNVPSFLYRKGVEVEVPKLGKVKLDISFGGVFIAFVDAKQVGLILDVSKSRELIEAGYTIREAVNERVKVLHPEKTHISIVLVFTECYLN